VRRQDWLALECLTLELACFAFPVDSGVPLMNGLMLDEDTHQVSVDGEPVALTWSEYELLSALMREPGVAVSSLALLRGLRPASGFDERALQILVSRLRRKLGESASAPRYVETVSGFGYRFRRPAAAVSVRLEFEADLVLRSVTPNQQFLGWDPASIIGTRFSPSGVPVDFARELVQARVAAGSLSAVVQVEVIASDGARVPAQVTTRIAVDEVGRFVGITGTFAFDEAAGRINEKAPCRSWRQGVSERGPRPASPAAREECFRMTASAVRGGRS